MKLIITLLMTLSSTIVFADFELIKDGTTYSCTEKIVTNPGTIITCIKSAQGPEGRYLSKDDAIILCKGAKNNSPVSCVYDAQGPDGRYLSKSESIELCQGVLNSAAVSCVYFAQGPDGRYLSKVEALNLCKGATDNSAVKCVYDAQGPDGGYLSKDEALKICKAGKVFSVGGVDYVEKFEPIKSLELFKRRFNLFKAN